MKRILVTVAIVLFAVTSAFAADGSLKGTGALPTPTGTDITTLVELKITPDQVDAYEVGFTNGTNVSAANGWENAYNDMTSVPDKTIKMDLAYNKDNQSVGHKNGETYYMFYKVRSASSFKLTLSSGGPLVDQDETSTTKNIDYTIEMSSGKGTVSSKNNNDPGSKWTLTVDPKAVHTGDNANYAADKVGMIFATTTAITAGMAGTYQSTLTLNVQTV